VISFSRSNAVHAVVATVATVASLALLGWVLAYWTWIWLFPRVETRVPAATGQDVPAVSAKALFGEAKRSDGTLSMAANAMKLQGVVAGSGNRRGYAVLQLDGREILAIREGEQIVPGIRLAEIHHDQVVVDRGGAREALVLPRKALSGEPVVRQGGK